MGIRRVATPQLEGSVAQPSLQEQAAQLDIDSSETLDIKTVDVSLIRPLSLSLVQEQQALPLWVKDGKIEVAICKPSSINLLDEYQLYFGKPIVPILVPEVSLSAWINKSFELPHNPQPRLWKKCVTREKLKMMKMFSVI